jgi:hypothetical protein
MNSDAHVTGKMGSACASASFPTFQHSIVPIPMGCPCYEIAIVGVFFVIPIVIVILSGAVDYD